MKHLFTFFILISLTSCGSDDSSSDAQITNQTSSSNPSLTLELEEPNHSPSNDPAPTIKVSGAREGSTLILHKDPSCDTQASDPAEVGSNGEVLITSYDLSEEASGDVEVTFYVTVRESEEGDPLCLSAGLSYVLDTTAPSAPATLSLEEPSTSPNSDPTPTLRVGGVESGATVTLYSDESCDTQVSEGVQVLSDEGSVSITSRNLGDGTQDVEVTFYAAGRDEAGNKSLCSDMGVSYVLDVTVPIAPSSLTLEEPGISPGTDFTPTINVAGVEEGATVTLYSDNSCSTQASDGVQVGGGESSVSIVGYPLEEGTTTFYAAGRDEAGNKSLCSSMGVSYVLDVTAPDAPGALVLEEPNTSPGTNPTPTLRVSRVEIGATLILYSDSSCDTQVSDGVQVLDDESGVSITSRSLGDGTQDIEVTFYAAQRDEAGNKSLCSSRGVSYVLDVTVPSAPSALTLEEPSTSPGTDLTPTINVAGVEAGATVTLYSDNSCSMQASDGVQVEGGESSISITSRSLGDGSQDVEVTFYAAQRDEAGNESLCSGVGVSYLLDVTAPLRPSALTLEEPTTSPSIDPTPTIRVSGVEAGATVTLYSDSSCRTQISDGVQVGEGESAVSITSRSLGDGSQDVEITFYALQRDEIGYESLCSSASVSYVADLTVPARPSRLSLSNPSSSPGESPIPIILVEGLEEGARVMLYRDSSCTDAVSSVQTVQAGQTSALITSHHLGSSDITVDYYSAQIDIFERSSSCSSASVSYAFIYNDHPIISGVSVETGSYFYDDPSGDVLEISVTFNKSVNVMGTPRLELTLGTTTRYAHSISGSGSSILVFSYDVSRDDYDNDGIQMADSIDLNGGTIKGSADENAHLNFTVPGNLGRVWINFEEKIFSTPQAFAFLKKGGSVVTWGNGDNGGDSTGVSSDLSGGVREIVSASNSRYEAAFAALKEDGSVLTWGYSAQGGDSHSVSSDLNSGVRKIFSNDGAFAALKNDGSVVTWGNSAQGGDSSSVSGDLIAQVMGIYSSEKAFAALKSDGSVVTWGNSAQGGDSMGVSSDLERDVVKIYSTLFAFAALKEGGKVVTWGSNNSGGNSTGVSSDLERDVVKIYSTLSAFAALKEGGEVVTWGDSNSGGNSDSVSGDLASGVTKIFSTFNYSGGAFAALKDDGSVVTWGNSAQGGDSTSVSRDLADQVSSIYSSEKAFAALKEDGSVITWGSENHGGNSMGVSSDLRRNVVEIFSNGFAFAALKDNGSVVTWGHNSGGGDSRNVSSHLSEGVVEVFSTGSAFAALKDDGSVITWGFSSNGGSSSGVDLGPRW